LGVNFLTYKEADEEGYFVLMMSPGVTEDKGAVLPKDIVFVLDKSGSMKGKKMQQAREALKYCVERLNEKDRFNIVDFSTTVDKFKDTLVDASSGNIKAALTYIEAMMDGGATNIDEALKLALGMLSKQEGRIAMVFFATDGLPTTGEKNIEALIKNTKDLNKANARIFSFGVGYDVNTLLLDKVGSDNRGISEYVKPEELIEDKVSMLYNKIQSPLFGDIEAKFNGIQVESLMPRSMPDIYKGMQLFMYGKYRKAAKSRVEISGHMGKERKTLSFEVDFPNEDTTNDFIPRLWASQRIAFLLDQITMSGKEDKELVDEIITLSKKYGIVTRYTAMLITEDNIHLSNGRAMNLLKKDLDEIRRQREESGQADKKLESKEAQFFSEKMKQLKADAPGEGYGQGQLAAELQEAEKCARERGQRLTALKTITNKTFYLIKGVWTDSRYDPEKDKDKVQRIKFGSGEYYKLTEDTALAKYLSAGENVIVVYKSKVYQIEKEQEKK
jgi:Ca-activated chloride channel family protein